jgi:hypothetical protein
MRVNSTLALRGNSEGEVFVFKRYARREGRLARVTLPSLANRLKSISPKREASPHSLRECCSLPR